MAEWLCCSKKRCLPNHKCCGLVFYSPCYILFLTCKSLKSQSPHEVLAESPLYGDYIGSLSGLLKDSLEIGRTSAKLGLIPKESLKTPQRLLRDSSRTPWTPWELSSNMWLSVMTSILVSCWISTAEDNKAHILCCCVGIS